MWDDRPSYPMAFSGQVDIVSPTECTCSTCQLNMGGYFGGNLLDDSLGIVFAIWSFIISLNPILVA